MRRFLLTVFLIALLAAGLYFFIYDIPARASILYGTPAAHLNIGQRIQYAAALIFHGDALFTPLDPAAGWRAFSIAPNESVFSVAARLQQDGFISNPQAFLDYVTYTGLDRNIQSGEYLLSSALSIVEIARRLQDSTPANVTFVILPGWRMEEIAASLPTSGLNIAPETFLAAAQTPPEALNFLPDSASMEGFFFPDTYIFSRQSATGELLDHIARNFVSHISADLQAGFQAQNLNLIQAVTLASMVEREAVRKEEMPLIASVFYNRLQSGMTLGSDPTVQYALGYDAVNQTWWKNPLSLNDLKFDSPYNTYIHTGLPPAPIANPSLQALQAVAFPQPSPYYYFRARCDNSGYHNFAVTFEEHLANGCQ